MNLDQFKNWALSQHSVANPQAGTHNGECVSLVQQYLYRVFGIPYKARGHAKDWATNADVLGHFNKVNNIQAGDILVYGATASNKYGHIAIALGGNQMLDQNGNSQRYVAVRPAWNSPIAILRKKGDIIDDMEKLNLGEARILAETILGRDRDATHAGKGDADLIAHHAGRPLTNAYINALWQSAEAKAAAKDRGTKDEFYKKWSKSIDELSARPTKAELEKVLADLQKESEKVAKAEAKLAEEQAKKSEDSILLDEAGNWLGKLFKRLTKR